MSWETEIETGKTLLKRWKNYAKTMTPEQEHDCPEALSSKREQRALELVALPTQRAARNPLLLSSGLAAP
jgi:hypothetical protein